MASDCITHSRMTDPGEFPGVLDSLPEDPADLCRIVQGLLVHSDWLSSYGLDGRRSEGMSRETLPVAERLRRVLEADGRPIAVERPPTRRSPATCRDFALMLCSFLRTKGTPARIRCGFASYFGDQWEDHWICEYWTADGERRVADPQMDAVLRREHGIGFDPADLPTGAFLTAGEAWLRCRSGMLDPARCGHGAAAGLWFAAVNVVRDHYAVNSRETSDWDTWREAGPRDKVGVEIDPGRYDALARDPEQSLAEMRPFWR